MEISDPRKISITDYDYNLPDSRIAKYPLPDRDASKLLVYNQSQIIDTRFCELNRFIPSGGLMIFNNTKVIQARLQFQKQTGAHIEIFCLEPHSPKDYTRILGQTGSCSWICLVGNLKKWKGEVLEIALDFNNKQIKLSAKLLSDLSAEGLIVEFKWDEPTLTFADILQLAGQLPIPPYLNRESEPSDNETYQTVYSKIKGSVAAPTAGLHFTLNIFDSLKSEGVSVDEVTLHVGAGTFKPVKTDLISDHQMHAEYISVSKETIKNILNHLGNITAVGTTSVRTLESLYYIGDMIGKGNVSDNLEVTQWQPYTPDNNAISVEQSLNNILDYLNKKNLEAVVADTRIIIAPGYKFKIVDRIVTNFHQPKSTLLLLVSAFVGNDNWKKIYTHALDNEYRFLSYGDSSLLIKE